MGGGAGRVEAQLGGVPLEAQDLGGCKVGVAGAVDAGIEGGKGGGVQTELALNGAASPCIQGDGRGVDRLP